MARRKKDETEPVVRHFLADGTQVDSIDGRVIPATGPTAGVYRVIARVALREAARLAAERAKAGTTA